MSSRESQQVTLPQGTITYRAAGPADSDRPPVVFIHGLLVNNTLWSDVADALAAQGIRSFAPNLPLGSHPVPMNPSADLTAASGLPDIINGFIDALELSDVTLVGSDTGGALCQFTIDKDPSRIGRLVLTNCDAFDVFPPKAFTSFVKVGQSALALFPIAAAIQVPAIRHTRNIYGGVFAKTPNTELTKGWATPLFASAGVRRDTAKLLQGFDASQLLDVSTRLPNFTKPVHLVWGDQDIFFPIEFGRRLAAQFPNARLTPIVGGRTFVSVEFPREVADAIADATVGEE